VRCWVWFSRRKRGENPRQYFRAERGRSLLGGGGVELASGKFPGGVEKDGTREGKKMNRFYARMAGLIISERRGEAAADALHCPKFNLNHLDKRWATGLL